MLERFQTVWNRTECTLALPRGILDDGAKNQFDVCEGDLPGSNAASTTGWHVVTRAGYCQGVHKPVPDNSRRRLR